MTKQTDDNILKHQVKEHWDKSSLTYDAHDLGTKEECNCWKQDFQNILGDAPLKVLDLGTGTGFIGIMLAELGHDVTGLDFSDAMMNKAKQKVLGRKLKYSFVIGDAEYPNFPDNSFDCVICRHLLWTLPNPDIAVREWARIIKPTGIMFIIDGQWGKKSIKQSLFYPSYWLNNVIRLKAGIKSNKYSNELKCKLPNVDGVKIDKLIGYFKDNDFKEIQSKSFMHIRDIQKKNLPWYLKYAYYNDIYGVWGKK